MRYRKKISENKASLRSKTKRKNQNMNPKLLRRNLKKESKKENSKKQKKNRLPRRGVMKMLTCLNFQERVLKWI